jgi:hypothetical protein
MPFVEEFKDQPTTHVGQTYDRRSLDQLSLPFLQIIAKIPSVMPWSFPRFDLRPAIAIRPLNNQIPTIEKSIIAGLTSFIGGIRH